MTKQYWIFGYALPASCRSASTLPRVPFIPGADCRDVRTRQGFELDPPLSSIRHRRREIWSHLLTWQTVSGHASLARRVLPPTPDHGNAKDLEGSAIHGSKRVEWGVSP